MKKNTIFEIRSVWPVIDLSVDDVENRVLSPLFCLRESEDNWRLEFDLPLVEKDDVKITIDENILSVEAKLRETYAQENLGIITKFEYFKKSVSLPVHVDHEKINQKFQNGRLLINIGKK